MVADWLDPKLTDPQTVRELIDSVPAPVLNPYPVSKAVNNVRNNSPEAAGPVSTPEPGMSTHQAQRTSLSYRWPGPQPGSHRPQVRSYR